MNKNTYRMASWWILWEDLIYPDKGIEEKIIKKAERFKAAGIDTAIIFGAHFRWDYIYIWDRLHELLNFIANTLHEQGIKLFDHHSANLVHRPKNKEQKWNIYYKNRHHVPFYPSKEMANSLICNGTKLNDFRMISVRTGKPCYLPDYEAEIFCMNNKKFREAYKLYLKKLMAETKIDGLMCDDVIYYPRWEGCRCPYCREKYKTLYRKELPDAADKTFWGNYESDAFKDWVEMRYNDSADFLAIVRDELGSDFPLMTCCSKSAGKCLNASGLSSQTLSKSVNHLMLEMCKEFVSSNKGYLERIPDIMLHQAISSKKNLPNIGLGYAHFPDAAFLIWAFNKLVGTSSWISTLKGRLGIPEKNLKLLPDESDIVKEGYLFEEKYPELFNGESMANIALYFSFETQVFYGDTEDDYVTSYRSVAITLFEKNMQFDVVEDIPSVKDYPVLILCDINCISDNIREKIIGYIEQGGKVIGSGPLGLRDERGHTEKTTFLSSFGINVDIKEPERDVDIDAFFELRKCPKRDISLSCHGEYKGKRIISRWIEIKRGKGSFYWTSGRCLDKNIVNGVINKVKEQIPDNAISVEVPEGWLYRIYRKHNKIIVHGLSNDFEIIPDKVYVNRMNNQPLIRHIRYKTGDRNVNITAPVQKALLYLPDIIESREGQINNGKISFSMEGIKRYFVIVLQVK
ncbi:MAG: hypothetical protein Q7J67_09915 [bacterium]|nr:hypothetical protein [bacterium]